jgi:putative ABC transport system permease protein
MKSVDLFSLSTRMFRTNPSRTWLTVLGISVGIAAVLFLISLGYGLQNVILQKIVFNQALLSLVITPSTDLIVLDEQSLSEVSKIKNVVDVAPLARFTGQVTLNGINGTVEMKTVDAPYFSYSGTVAKYGSLYEEKDQNQILVSDAVLKLFGITDPNAVLGQKVKIKIFSNSSSTDQPQLEIVNVPVEYTIKGVVDDTQESYVFFPLKEITNYVAVKRYEEARVRVNVGEDMALVKEDVLSRGYQTQSLSETIDQANKIFGVIQVILGLFGAVALVVSSIGMFNTMTVTLLERTNEIGIMRALGASKKNLRNLFLSESVIIGFLGGLVGTALGILGGQIFNFVINSLAARFGGAKTDLFVYPIWFLIIIISLSIFIGFLSGIFPARRAASMDPLEALRYK